MRLFAKSGIFAAIALLVVFPAWSEEGSGERAFTILYTADIHDHLLPGKEGLGGLGSVASYVDAVRSETETVFLVDAGDAAEKGDFVAYRHKGALTYRLMRSMGYDVLAVGNHEQNLGLNRVRELNEVGGGVFTSVNLLDDAGNLMFAPFRILGSEGQRVAFIGASLPGRFTVQDIGETSELIREYASIVRTQHDADVVVVVIHAGLDDIKAIAALNPEVDAFIGGHTHRNIEIPAVVNEPGAIAVQTAHYANFVGRLDFEYQGGEWTAENTLVTMRHADFPPDPELLAVLRTETAQLEFDPAEVITRTDQPVGFHAMARIAAAAVRIHYDADIAFIHPTFTARSIVYPGEVTANDIFKTLADRGEDLLEFRLTGADIEAYMNGLANRDSASFGFAGWGQSMASGFKAQFSASAGNLKGYAVTTDLEPAREYRVIMTLREWDHRFARLMKQEGRAFPVPARVEGGTFAPMLARIRAMSPGQSLLQEAGRLQALYGSMDPAEAETEAQIIDRHLLAD